MKNIELLAPAGTVESLYAAINNGANAIYMGGTKFSARAYASNFTNEDLKNVVKYAHLYGVKIFIAVNTLIKENELKEAIQYIDFLYSVGVDALIVQDFGIAKVLKDRYKDFEIHSSTQMTIHNGEGAKFLKSQGFHRIVLARELSLKEIKYISSDLDIETEIFVHGALCICYSGQCLMSSIIGGRSGNRGRCAQPCRLPYEMINTKDGTSKKAYILSPKDMCNIDNVEDLIKTGTSSLKIEGRMKRPEYVAGVVKSYREAIDSYYNKEVFDSKKDEKVLLQLFNREGFSKAYLYGNKGKDMMSYNFPKNTGVYLGKAESDGSLVIDSDITLGDGIRFGDKGFTLSKILLNNKEVRYASKGDKVILYPKTYKKGDVLYKTLDSDLMKSYEPFCRPFERKIPLTCFLSFKINEEIELKFQYEEKEFVVKGTKVEIPKTKAISKERIEEALGKCNDTPFKFEKFDFQCYEEGFIPISSLNNLRRMAIENLENYIEEKSKKREVQVQEKVVRNRAKSDVPKYMAVICTKEQLKAALEENVGAVALDIFSRVYDSLDEKDLKKVNGIKTYIKIPNIIKEEFQKVVDIISRNLENINGIITANLGVINMFKDKTDIIGDYKLNIYNSKAVNFFENVLDCTTLSIELNKKEIEEVMKKVSDSNIGYMVYGKPELMISEYCPVGAVMGGKDSTKECSRQCLKGRYVLKDRKNEEFLIKNDIFCRTGIYNGASINLIDNIKELEAMGIKNFRLDFIDEGYEETKKVIKYLITGKGNMGKGSYTRGHYKRGVE